MNPNNKKIPIIDLFAGPGGLGEGFMSLMDENNQSIFDIKLSIEKDKDAHNTLTWRSFYRQFKKQGKEVPDIYYRVLQEPDLKKREELISEALGHYPEGKVAQKEARLIELGAKEWPAEEVDSLIREQLGDTQNWVLIGGPPCQAYSNVGRSRVGGIDPEDHRVYLYEQYLRIIEEHRPAVFVMENVKGLLSARVNGKKVFDKMLDDLSLDNKYQIHSLVKPVEIDKDYLIKSENYGIPQMRHRVILLGVRDDHYHDEKNCLAPVSEKVILESVIGDLPRLRSGLNREFKQYDQINLSSNGDPRRVYQRVVDSDETWKRLIRSYLLQIEKWGDLPVDNLKQQSFNFELGKGSEFISTGLKKKMLPEHLSHWYQDERLKGVVNHEARAHLTHDLMRYLFASLYVKKYDTFPRLEDYAKHSEELLPDHANVRTGKFSDRFRVQLPDRPATTVTSHISKDGHYFIHYDPEQCRSLTVREAARIQTFPDNYLFRGSRTAQYHQVGNAVPPYLAFQIARIVKDIIK